ncbi:Panacea domain-containing protein [Metaclostridioides mangenotii]|uniref:Panacea domain-containing protein n=1 Tax=Metaclostridioides mangenotii TaxID=1540 RepID=UPI000466783A|nr:type II toxin-antitoxin system antitoxin SocA domain-containing protein [Clostridioides mangenotii]
MVIGKCDAMDVAEFVIVYCEKKENPITNLQLQKILYYIQCEYLKETNKWLFENCIEAWDYGAAVPDVYFTYSKFISYKITGVIPKYNNIFSDLDKEIMTKVIVRISKQNVWTVIEKMKNENPYKLNYSSVNRRNEIPYYDIEEWVKKERII